MSRLLFNGGGEMRNLFKISILSLSLIAAGAYANVPTFQASGCDPNVGPYVNLFVNFSLGDTMVTQYGGYSGEGHTTINFNMPGENFPGNQPDISHAYTTVQCIKTYKRAIFTGITSITSGLTNNVEMPVANCSLKVRPKQVSQYGNNFYLYVKWNPSSKSYYCSTNP